MLEGISQIKEKVHKYKYVPNDYVKYDIDEMVTELKKDSKFKNFSDDELYQYALGLRQLHEAGVLRSDLNSMGFHSGKPQDPFWGQYTYEEILNMVNDGVTVPQEFVDWAQSMQDSDTTSYQIEGASEDPNTYENLVAETSNLNQTDVQKRAQAFASKAEAQEELIENKCDEAKPLANTVQAEKNELEQNQKMALNKIDSMTTEWQALDRKFKNGEELTDNEQKRYKELGLMLNDKNNNLMVQAQKVSGDIEELMNQIENIDMLLGINERINAEIEDVGTRIASFEGNKKHVILSTSSGNQVTGLTAAIYAASMGNNLAIDTGLKGINLFFSNLDVEREIDSNLTLVEKTQENVHVATEAANNKDQNLKSTTNKQAENQGDDKKADDTNPNAPVDKNEPDTAETVLPEDDVENADSENKKGFVESVQDAISSKTENKNTLADKVSEVIKQNAVSKTNLETVNPAATPTVSAKADANSNAVSAQASQVNESAETTEASSTTQTTETTENNATSVETEDPLAAETSQYVSECQSRSTSMQIAEQEIEPKANEIKNIKETQKQEDAKIQQEIDKNLKEYETLVNKLASGEDMTDDEQARIAAIEKALNAENGTLIAEMQNKANTLAGFVEELNNAIQATGDNIAYGEEAVEKGKEYAKSILGDREYLRDVTFVFILSKEEQYDLLYGKSGESLGRDAIDNGELLIENASVSNARLSNSLPLAEFANNYSQELNDRIKETNEQVASVNGGETITDTSGVNDTAETAAPETGEDALQAETAQYVSDCASKNDAMIQAEEQLQPKIENIKKLQSSQKQDDAKLAKELDKDIREYQSLAEKAANGDELTEGEQKRVKALEKALNSKNGTYIAEMKAKVSTLLGFSDELEADIQMSEENVAFGEESIAKGEEYALATLGDRSRLLRMHWFSEDEIKDILYGKSGESLGRDAIDNGELLRDNATATHERLSKSLPLGTFAKDYAQDLNIKINETNAKVNSIKTNLKSATTDTSSQVDENGEGESKTSTKSEKKEVTKEDGQKVEKQGKNATKEGQQAKKDGEAAKKDKQATDKQIKSETAKLKSDEKRIINYTKASQEINQQFEEMNNEVEAINEEKAQNSSNGNSSSPVTALNSNASGAIGGNGVSLNSTQNSAGAMSSDSTAKLQAIAARVPNLDKQLKSNDKTIKTLQKSSQAKTKKLTKLYNIKYKQTQADIKAKEEKMQKNEKLQGTITKTGYMFTGTKLTGLALMSMPWSASIGAYMYGIGKYGEITCYVANAAIDVANGNFLGALVNVAAAALSYVSGPKTIGPAQSAVTEAATEGLKETGKEVATEGLKEVGTETVKETGTEILKETGTEVLKETGSQVGTEVAKETGTQLLTNTTTGSLAAMVGSGTELAMQGVGEMMQETSKAITQQMAKEAAKHALKETIKDVALNAASAAMPTLVQMTHKQETGQPEEQKKQRRLLSYQEKRNKMSKMDKIQKTTRVLMSRGNKKH